MDSEYDSSNLNNVIVRSFLPEVAICDLANGKQAKTDGSGCECAAGSFQSDPVDTTLCSVCPSGFYSTQAAQTLCVACERGTYSKMERATTGDICRECDAGKFGAAIGLASDRACTDCSTGQYSSFSGATACISCGGKNYSVSKGSVVCTRSKQGENYVSALSPPSLCEAGTYGHTPGVCRYVFCCMLFLLYFCCWSVADQNFHCFFCFSLIFAQRVWRKKLQCLQGEHRM